MNFHKNPPSKDTKDWTMLRFGGKLREEEAATKRRGGNHNGRTPQGMTGPWVKDKGGIGGSALEREMAADSGTCHRD